MFPRLIHHGQFDLYTYGVLFAISVLVGMVLVVIFSRRQKIDVNKTLTLATLAALSGIMGAKFLFVALEWNYYSRHLSEIFSQVTLRTGGVFSGGLVTAIAFSGWYIYKHYLPVLRTVDVFAPALALGHAIGRLGCLAAGCCYGKPTTGFWGITFSSPLASDLSHTPLGVPLHPTQLFESAIEVANFFILVRLLDRKRFDGQVMAVYLAVYGVARFFLEFLRGDPGRGEVFNGLLTGTQLIAIGLLIGGVVLAVVAERQKVADTACPGQIGGRFPKLHHDLN